jgi:hypothetical protein
MSRWDEQSHGDLIPSGRGETTDAALQVKGIFDQHFHGVISLSPTTHLAIKDRSPEASVSCRRRSSSGECRSTGWL